MIGVRNYAKRVLRDEADGKTFTLEFRESLFGTPPPVPQNLTDLHLAKIARLTQLPIFPLLTEL